MDDLKGASPLILPIGPDITVNQNDTLSLECYSNEPIHWVFPWDINENSIWNYPDNIMHEIRYTYLERNQLYMTQLDLFGVSHELSGFYYCTKNSSYFHCSDVVSPIQNKFASKIYLYVQGKNFSSKTKKLRFVNMFIIFPGQRELIYRTKVFYEFDCDFFITCKPTTKNQIARLTKVNN